MRTGQSALAGERLQEAVNINLGLLALKNVIDALHARRAHVPWGNDQLTALLQASLGGAGRTAVLVTGRPEGSHAHETLQALRFAEGCASVELRAKGRAGKQHGAPNHCPARSLAPAASAPSRDR